jgi:Ca2+-binding EF-hand superfamily protein
LNISDEEWEEILMSVDVNGDGHIDFTEFIGVTFDR